MKLNTSLTILFITTRHRYAFFCKCKAQNLVWIWYGRLSSIPFLKSSIPFHSAIFHIPYRNIHSIFHSIPCPGCRFFIIIIIATFYPNGCSQFRSLKIRKRLILKKMLPLPAPFQRFRFRVRFRFQPLSSKCFRFHKKLPASTASTSSFCFHIPGLRARWASANWCERISGNIAFSWHNEKDQKK